MTETGTIGKQRSGCRVGRSLFRVAVAMALTTMGLAVGHTAASADTGDGTVQVRVVQEVNANGVVDDSIMEPPLGGVTVHLTDADGNSVSATTGNDGIATFDPSTSNLVGGQYRVDVDNPKPGTYFPGHAANGQSAAASLPIDLTDPNNEKLSSSTEFIDVRDGQDSYVNAAFWYPPYYCQENATICDANQPWTAEDPGVQSPPTEQTLFSVPYQFTAAVSKLAENQDTGTVYGIAYDRAGQRIFSAAYAKRGSPYGPGGPGGIYVTDLTGPNPTEYPLQGDTSLWNTVPNAGTDNHAMDVDDDLAFNPQVGTEALGDIDVSNDGRYLFGVNEYDKTVFVYDLTDDSYQGSYSIPNQCDNPADWRPMGTGAGIDGNFVGGVCSGQADGDMNELSAHVLLFDPSSGDFGDQILSQPLTYERGFTIRPVLCDGTLDGKGRWFAWTDTYPWGPNEEQEHGCDGPPGGVGNDGTTTGNYWLAYPQPMMSDIVEETNGDLVVSFRDRTADQGGTGALMETVAGTQFYNGWGPASGGDLVRGCRLTDGTFVLDPNYDTSTMTLAPGSVCTDNNVTGSANGGQGTNFREFYIRDYRVSGSHTETFFGGMALSRVEPNLVISGMDPTDAIMTQGISAVNRDGGQPVGTIGVLADQPSDRFGKGAGMADLEVLCDEAPIQIGNRVWSDDDGDGVQDPGEPPIAGATVNLYDSVGTLVGTTTTDDNGTYYFDDSNLGTDADGNPYTLGQNADYVVKLDNPDDYADGGPLAGRVPTVANTGDDDQHDSDGMIPDGGTYPQIALTTRGAGEDNHTYDFGFVSPVSIGDYLWIDADGDGVQDQSEPPVPGATVNLLDSDGNPVATATTDADGFYVFTDLPPNTDFTVQFPTTATVDGTTYVLTAPTQGGDDAADSNPDQTSGAAPVTTPATGANSGEPGQADDPTIDAGYTPLVSIGDYVWLDAGGDGVQDAGEAPVPGATVTLLDGDGNTVATTTTDSNGFYSFTDLLPNTEYTVQFPTDVTVDGVDYVLTPPSQGEDTAADSNPNPANGKASVTTPKTGNNSGAPGKADDPTIDAGYHPKPVSIGDYVWLDTDGDGVQDKGEKPVPGATVTLLDSDGSVVATTKTDKNGYYSFTDLAPNADYTVAFPTTVTVDGSKYQLTGPGQGANTGRDSNPDQQSGKAAVTTPKSGNNSGAPGKADDATIDAGYTPILVSVGDYVWLDADGDGVQDDGEAPAPSATVTLLDSDGNVVASITTDEHGYYAFTDLQPDTDYQIKFPTTVTVDGIDYPLTGPGQGNNPGADSNPEQASGIALVHTPSSGNNSGEPGKADNPTIDAGYAPRPVSIGDYVWIDADGNGVQDTGEKPVPGVTVTLLGADGNVVATTTTDEGGFYAFTGLMPDTRYGVQFPTTVTVDGKDYPLTKPGQGGNPGLDSTPDASTGVAWLTTPKSGGNSAQPGRADNPTIDAGYAPTDVAGTGGGLSYTGVDAGGMLAGAMLLLFGGAVLLLAGRRRRRHAL